MSVLRCSVFVMLVAVLDISHSQRCGSPRSVTISPSKAAAATCSQLSMYESPTIVYTQPQACQPAKPEDFSYLIQLAKSLNSKNKKNQCQKCGKDNCTCGLTKSGDIINKLIDALIITVLNKKSGSTSTSTSSTSTPATSGLPVDTVVTTVSGTDLPTGTVTNTLPTGTVTNTLPTGTVTNTLPTGTITNTLPTDAVTNTLSTDTVTNTLPTDVIPSPGNAISTPTNLLHTAASVVPGADILATDTNALPIPAAVTSTKTLSSNTSPKLSNIKTSPASRITEPIV